VLFRSFDMKLWPDANHGFANAYTLMVAWDYFVEHLLGETPPEMFKPDFVAAATAGAM